MDAKPVAKCPPAAEDQSHAGLGPAPSHAVLTACVREGHARDFDAVSLTAAAHGPVRADRVVRPAPGALKTDGATLSPMDDIIPVLCSASPWALFSKYFSPTADGWTDGCACPPWRDPDSQMRMPLRATSVPLGPCPGVCTSPGGTQGTYGGRGGGMGSHTEVSPTPMAPSCSARMASRALRSLHGTDCLHGTGCLHASVPAAADPRHIHPVQYAVM